MPYRGYNNLRSAKEEITLESWQEEEIKKCADDPEYFIRNYCYINTRDNGMQLFNLRPRQAQELKNMRQNRFIKADWYRQSGHSTTVLAYMLWDTVFSKKVHLNVYLGEKDSRCREEFAKVREMYIRLPYWMQPGVKAWTNELIALSTGSRIMARIAKADWIRSLSPDIAFIDNFGFLTDNRAVELAQSAIPTIMSGTSKRLIIGKSHKFGLQTPFNLEFWKNNEKHFFVSENTWDTDTQHDEEWAEAERTKIGDFEFERRYVGTIVQDVMDSSKKDEPAPIPFWAGAIDRIPDLIRRTKWKVKFHSHRKDWETLNEHLSVYCLSHGEVEYCGKKYPALKLGIMNDEGAVASAMDLEGYVTADLEIFDWKLGELVADIRYECVCLNSLIAPEILAYDDLSKPEFWRTELTLIIMDRCPIVDGKGRIPEIVDETDDEILLEYLGATHGWRENISNFLEDNCHA